MVKMLSPLAPSPGSASSIMNGYDSIVELSERGQTMACGYFGAPSLS